MSTEFDIAKAKDAAKFDDAKALKLFPAAIAHIEELEAGSKRLTNLLKHKDEKLQQLESSVSTWEITAKMALSGQAKLVEEEQAKQIQKLQDALIEERAACVYYSTQPIFKTWAQFPEDACHCKKKDTFRMEARQQLEAEGLL